MGTTLPFICRACIGLALALLVWAPLFCQNNYEEKRENDNTPAFELRQNYPNPFHFTTSLEFTVPERATTTLEMLDMTGRKVATLMNGTLEPGSYLTVFNAREVPRGVYVFRLQAGKHTASKMGIVMK